MQVGQYHRVWYGADRSGTLRVMQPQDTRMVMPWAPSGSDGA